MNPPPPPSFNIEKARRAQIALSKMVISRDVLPTHIRYVAGVDVAYFSGLCIGAVAVLEYESLNHVESQTAVCKEKFPYVPTLLSFREVPPSVSCIKKLKIKPDVYLVDGHGLAHPYRCGFATHLGVVLKAPTVGVAKSRLFGEIEDNETQAFKYLKHNGEVIGALLATHPRMKPVIVSVGNMVSLETAINIVKKCSCISRIPEPIRKAHQAASEFIGRLKK